jgi:hypothetical protein
MSDTETPRPMFADINTLPIKPILQAPVSRDSWVKVAFYSENGPTQAEIYRAIELLCEMHNGWS